MSMRMALLHIDAGADLPLVYTYDPRLREFRTVGCVRLRGLMIPEPISHRGADTRSERDAFLRKVLTALRLTPRQVERVVRTAEHPDGERLSTEPTRYAGPSLLPGAPAPAGVPAGVGGLSGERGEERDGGRFAGPGMLLGLLAGLFTGYAWEGWSGAVIGAWIGASTCGDLLVACWQVAHVRSPRNYVLVRDTLALLLVAAGSIVGALGGYVLGSGDFGRARGVFLGMALAAFVLSAVSTSFSRMPFWGRSPMWLGPLCIGLAAWGLHTLWSHPASLVAAILVGTWLAGAIGLGATGGAGHVLSARR
ncbi:hypothetical protein [Streptomyces xinghaiensis]|uniref:hypothetical protein n=1 Tax=Streptomyces xinghaiensis TaxID=1038928 RepID=UPI0012FFA812|nr:hypothetical protein [Streptomyces xinghaiensis]MZE78612.1 hypothetical protein [Streptomyces sp. SID5475]